MSAGTARGEGPRTIYVNGRFVARPTYLADKLVEKLVCCRKGGA